MILHVMKYHDQPIDYLVGAQLEGFDRMVRLSEDADFILIEGDEYLSSAIDRRPKFLWYKPNIALISGIAWDHINVFHSEDIYVDQFRQFIEAIIPGGSLTYYFKDSTLNALVDSMAVPIRKFPYAEAAHEIRGDQTYLTTEEGPLALSIFGAHNMANIQGAQWICQQLGIDRQEFYEAIASFKGAAKRLQPIRSTKAMVYKDFAHAPSKVRATCSAVKQQYPNHSLHAFLELHTYSSLTPEFMTHYHGSLQGVDTAVVLYDPEALALKRMQPLSEGAIRAAFGREDVKVITSREALVEILDTVNTKDAVILMMSSGNFAQFDFNYFNDL
jgi:UDP-N-acetylmuramate: L-alanyl-gamma-D-glutamyl-meso-diaminopimelate ligase